MRCGTARRIRLDVALGLASRQTREALAAHLTGCRACACREPAEAALDAGLAALRAAPAVEVEVTARVLARIADARPLPAGPATTGQLAWAAGAASAFALGLLVGLVRLLPDVPVLASEARIAATGIGQALSGLVAAIGGLAGGLAKLLGHAITALAALAGTLESLQPLALATVALSSLMMAASIALVVARDLRHARWIAQEPRT